MVVSKVIVTSTKSSQLSDTLIIYNSMKIFLKFGFKEVSFTLPYIYHMPEQNERIFCQCFTKYTGYNCNTHHQDDNLIYMPTHNP